jgi:hypothetical protein
MIVEGHARNGSYVVLRVPLRSEHTLTTVCHSNDDDLDGMIGIGLLEATFWPKLPTLPGSYCQLGLQGTDLYCQLACISIWGFGIAGYFLHRVFKGRPLLLLGLILQFIGCRGGKRASIDISADLYIGCAGSMAPQCMRVICHTHYIMLGF